MEFGREHERAKLCVHSGDVVAASVHFESLFRLQICASLQFWLFCCRLTVNVSIVPLLPLCQYLRVRDNDVRPGVKAISIVVEFII